MSDTPRSPNHCVIWVDDFSSSNLGAVSPWQPRLRPQPPAVDLLSVRGEGAVQIDNRRLCTPGNFNVGVETSVFGGEIMGQMEGSPFRWHHVGFPSANFREEFAGLEAAGYTRDVWKVDDGRLVVFGHLMSPQGLKIELVQNPPEPSARVSESRARLEAAAAEYVQIQRDYEASQEASLAAGEPRRERVFGRAVDHVAAVVDDPDTEVETLTKVLGMQWGDFVESEATLVENGTATPIVTRSIHAVGAPVRVYQREWKGNRLPGDSGWNHVAWKAEDLATGVADLEAAGFNRLAAWAAPTDGGGAAVLLQAPEGTCVKLVAA